MRYVVSICAFLFIPLVAWVGGLDFQRGDKQALTLVLAAVLGVGVFVIMQVSQTDNQSRNGGAK